MINAVELTINTIVFVVQVVPIGTNVGLLRILWAMMNGSFIASRGAVHGALCANDFSEEEIRRSWSALRYGSWTIADLLSAWQVRVASRNEWKAGTYEGYRVRSVDITGFWRPRLKGQVNKHYNAVARCALPAIVFGVMVSSGKIREKRVPLLQAIVRCKAGTSEADFRVKLLEESVDQTEADEITVLDAGFSIAEVHAAQVKRFVLREAINCTARRNTLPPYKGKGAHPKYGELIRPLARTRLDKTIPATPPEDEGSFQFEGRTIRYHSWSKLVTTATQAEQGKPTFAIHVFYDPAYKKPLVLATDMNLQTESIYLIYKDRWPVEHPPLAAKQMIGLHRQFVFANESTFRLPELALLAGNMLTHIAASLPPMPTGFWDRTPKATPGRLRRVLARAIFPDLDPFSPELRKKNSVSDHLPKGIHAHRRSKAVP